MIADIFGYINPSVINELILAVLSAMIYLNVLTRREFHKLSKKADIEGITAFHTDRSKIPSLEKILLIAKKEIILKAVQHRTLTHQYLGLLQKKAELGCRIKILMMDSIGPEGKINPNVQEHESHKRYTGFKQQIESCKNSFLSWINSLAPDVRKMIEIRTYLECPVTSYIIVDRETLDGFIQVEILLYGIYVNDMPHFVVTKKDGGRFFDIHCESFDRL